MSKRSPAAAANATELPPVEYNPVSKWQEYTQVAGLTLYDIHRQPRREDQDPDARVRVQLKVK